MAGLDCGGRTLEAIGARSCPVCAGQARVHLRGLYDDRFGYPGTHDLLRCRSCGHKFLAASFTAVELSQLYTHYYPRASMDPDQFRPYEEKRGRKAWWDGEGASAFRWVPPRIRILDIGCSFGETLAYHQARGCDAEGVEADANVLSVARRHGLSIRIGLFDPSDYAPESFDYITADQVIEHASDPRSFLAGVASLLRPGGMAVLSTPNSGGYGARLFGRRWINWHVPYHLQHFSRRSMSILARESGLRVVSIRTISNSAWLQYQWLHLWSRPPAGEPSPFWDPARSPKDMPRRLGRISRGLERAKVFPVVTRLADGVGIGDNFVCILQKPADGSPGRHRRA